MFCAISGEPPEQPVVSKNSGALYEKRLIVKYIAEHGKEPGTEETLTEDDLISLNVVPKTVKPRPPTLASVPALLSAFQNEWDGVMLETYTLKEKYAAVRQELSHALYQYDAACHVIARLTKERDAAKEALANVQIHVGAPVQETADVAMEGEEEEGALPAEAIAKIDEVSKELSKTRRKRKAPEELATPEEISSFTTVGTATSLHSASASGITCMDYDATNNLLLTGGTDKTAQIYNRADGKVASQLKGHTKKINSVLWHNRENEAGKAAFTGSADKTVRVWNANDKGKYSAAHILKEHRGEITGLAQHPSGDYLLTSSLDSTWSFYDIETGKPLYNVAMEEAKGFTGAALHPDGLIYATGANENVVQIWDVKSRGNVATFDGHQGAITALTFSENGYTLATAASGESCVRIWDLRKLKNVHTLELTSPSSSPSSSSLGPVRTLDFDYTGTYLAAGGMDVRVWKVKGWNPLLTKEDHTAEITGVKFGKNAKELVSTSMDRSAIFLGLA